MPSRHAILGPSSAHRWLVCTPSARFEEQIPNEDSVFSREGTLAHELAALVLSSRCGVFQGPQKQFNDMMESWQAEILAFYKSIEAVDPWAEYLVMLEHAEEWAAYVQDIYQRSDYSRLYIEREFDLSQFVPLGFGTSDGTVALPTVLHCLDYKYGAGKVVVAENNDQLKLYALGALTALVREIPDYKPETVVLHIFQPRAGGASAWSISVGDLLEWAEFTVAPAAALAIAGQGDFVAGNHCQFCRAQTVCRARFKEFEAILRVGDRREMSDRDRALVLDRGDVLASWVKKVKEKAVADLQSGKKVAGFKLVAGSGRRHFTNEDAVVDALLSTELCEDIFESKMRSLTDIEKSLGKKRFATLLNELVYTKAGAPVLVGEEDSRPSIGASAHDDYEDDEAFEDLT